MRRGWEKKLSPGWEMSGGTESDDHSEPSVSVRNVEVIPGFVKVLVFRVSHYFVVLELMGKDVNVIGLFYV
jgi:hypothetical protein